MPGFLSTSSLKKYLRWIGWSVLVIAAFTALRQGYLLASAAGSTAPPEQASPLHPDFPLLDDQGANVLDSHRPVSTLNTCGACHDTQFITEHSYHASVGLDELIAGSQAASGRAWDLGPGFYGSWNALEYRYLSGDGDQVIDLTTPDWLKVYGPRHVGGGPGVFSRTGVPLNELEYQPNSLETNIYDPDREELIPWDWEASGVVEMNCFLCHTPDPNNTARIDELRSGRFGWANTATLLGSDLLEKTPSGYLWDAGQFTTDQEVSQETIQIQDPTSENCGLCHGLVHDNVEDPLVTTGCAPERWTTITTGQIISPQRLSDTGMNLKEKTELHRAWDVHAERLLECTDCHYALNNPLYYQESAVTQPDHLVFDPRRVEIGDYLLKPLHQFARGSSAQTRVTPELQDTMRSCEGCHSIANSHSWLPYKSAHLNALSCESCHIPQMYSSANMSQDWTVITPEGTSSRDCRGVEGEPGIASLLTGYQPVLLPEKDQAGSKRLEPYNLITSWYWVAGDPPRPVPLRDLQNAYLEDGKYLPGVTARFDSDGDGLISKTELRIDNQEKERFIKTRLQQLGYSNPRIKGEVQPYSISHTVTTGEWALKDCRSCHGSQSRITAPIKLANYLPGGVQPQFVEGTNLSLTGSMVETENGTLAYQPGTDQENLYVLGHDSSRWIDLFGSLLFAAVLLGVLGHAGLRVMSRKGSLPHDEQAGEQVYMYGFYERLWHWLQTVVVILLLLTGLIIHKPDTFGIFSFRGVVIIHNMLAAILVINAFLAFFYHLVSGEIQQYIPRPRGFFDRSVDQAFYYLRGIFRGEEHPFEKTPARKLNPLQQITYFGLLNILLPLQIITGALMWGTQHWPELAGQLGGLPFLAPFHTLVAWLFAVFTVMHVYLTTTGHTPTANIKAMIFGWETLPASHESDSSSEQDEERSP